VNEKKIMICSLKLEVSANFVFLRKKKKKGKKKTPKSKDIMN